MIHDRLPFLDLLKSAFLSYRGEAGLVHRACRRQQVWRVAARVFQRLNPRIQRLTFLGLGYKRQQAFGIRGDSRDDHAEI